MTPKHTGLCAALAVPPGESSGAFGAANSGAAAGEWNVSTTNIPKFTEHANDSPDLLRQYGVEVGECVTNPEGHKCYAVSGAGKPGDYPSIRYRKDIGGDTHYCTPSTWKKWHGE